MKDIEKKIKQDANNASFEFKEEYWNAALIKLKQAEKMAIVKRFFWVMGLVVLVGGATHFTWDSFKNSDNSMLSDTIEANQNNTNSAQVLSNKENKLGLKNSDNKIINTDIKQDGSLKNSSDEIQENTPNTLNGNLTLNTNNHITSGNSNSGNLNSINNSSSSGNSSSSSAGSNSRGSSRGGSTGANTNKTGNQNSNVGNNSGSGNNNAASPSGSSSVANNNSPALNSTSSGNNSSSESAGIAVLEKLKLPLPQVFLASNDSIISQFQAVQVPELKNNSFKRLSLQAFAGGILHKKYSEVKGMNFNLPYAGFELKYFISQPLSISTGFGFYQLKMDPLAISIEDKLYGFGLEHTASTLSFEKSSWLEIPLKFTYNVSKGHFIGLGGDFSMLLSVKNSISDNRIYTDLNIEESDVVKSIISDAYKNYTSPFSNAISVFGSYQYQYNKFGAEIKYHYGLTDLLDNELMNSRENETNSRFTFTIKYSIF